MKLELSKEWYEKNLKEEGEVGCGSVEGFEKNMLSQYIGLIYPDAEYFMIKIPGFALTVYCSTLEEIQITTQAAFQVHVDRLKKEGGEIPAPLFLSEIKEKFTGWSGLVVLWLD